MPRMLACWSSSSFSCCSRSMAMINGTTSMRNVVPAIQAALPVLFMSFFVTNAASFAACLPRTTTWDCENFAITPSSSFLGFRLSGREMPPFRAWAAIRERERERGLGSGWMDCEFTLGKEGGGFGRVDYVMKVLLLQNDTSLDFCFTTWNCSWPMSSLSLSTTYNWAHLIYT